MRVFDAVFFRCMSGVDFCMPTMIFKGGKYASTGKENKMNKISRLFSDKCYRTGVMSSLGFRCRWLSDEEFTRRIWKLRFGSEINLQNPVTYNEKIQWLKLFFHNPDYVRLVDKYEVKKIIAEKVGKEYVVPTYGVWEDFDDIDFDSLPDSFVLKCTHDSGGVAVIRDKKNMDIAAVRKKIKKCLKTNFYWHGREWQYKNIKPRVMAEKYLEDQSTPGAQMIDYKFFCFDGEPEFLYVSQGFENPHSARVSFLTLDWQKADFQRTDYKKFDKIPPAPSGLEEMKYVSRELSRGIPFVRVDLYQVNGQVLFSELTFTPCGGYMTFDNPTSDLMLGNMINLPEKMP